MDDPTQQVPNANPSQPVSQDMPGGVQMPPVEPVEPVQQPEQPSAPVSGVEVPEAPAEAPQAGGMQ